MTSTISRQLRRKMGEAANSSSDQIEVSEEDRTLGFARNQTSFVRWRDNHPDVGKCDWINGKIILRELPYFPHAKAMGNCIRHFTNQDPQGQFFEADPACDIQLRAGVGVVEPDVILNIHGISNIPGGNFGQQSYAGIVIEVATSQRPRDLVARANYFMGPAVPTCEYYVGLKRYGVQDVSGEQAMCAIVYDRGHIAAAGGVIQPVDLVSFGTGPLYSSATWRNHALLRGVGHGGPPCNGPNLAPYVLNFPANRVFSTRLGGIPIGAPVNITLDLWIIHTAFVLPFGPI